ncbi:hypothetical protein MHBO_001782 [Bonamia ostreae]|uniref:Reverse transcriptase domain-containing protein n=1 Tax=Bonamia ostreae TaxID=126728 RepID=A0ABV2AK55_9EUKA
MIKNILDKINKIEIVKIYNEKSMTRENAIIQFERAIFANTIKFTSKKSGKLSQNWYTKTKGVLQGSILAPILANLYLQNLDKNALKFSQIKYYRSVDDMICFANGENILNQFLKFILKYLKSLKLEINEKSKFYQLKNEQTINWCGYSIQNLNNKNRLLIRKNYKSKFSLNPNLANMTKINDNSRKILENLAKKFFMFKKNLRFQHKPFLKKILRMLLIKVLKKVCEEDLLKMAQISVKWIN